MQPIMITITAAFALMTIGLTVGYPSVLSNSVIYNDDEFSESRNFLQQLIINQIVNILPQNLRDQINEFATLFGFTRNDFLLRVLKELQAFQTYSKIDFITAIQKTIKFVEEELTEEQKREVETLGPQGIQLATLLFTNQLKAGELNKFYDLLVKVVRKQAVGQTLVDELPIIIAEILSLHS